MDVDGRWLSRWGYRLSILPLILLVLHAGCSRDDTTSRGDITLKSGRLSDVQLSVTSHKKKLLLHEPCFLTILVLNKSSTALNIQYLKDQKVGWVRVLLRKKTDSTWIEYDKWPIVHPVGCGTHRSDKRSWGIPPSESRGMRTAILYRRPSLTDHGTQLAFSEAGSYQIRVELIFNLMNCDAVSSGVLAVEISEPEGVDRKALGFIASHGLSPRLIPSSGSHHATSRLVKFTELYPASIYAQYANLVLASGCFYDNASERIKYWRKLVKLETQDHHTRALAASGLIREYRNMDDHVKADEILAYIKRQLGDQYERGRSYYWRAFSVGTPFFK